MNWTIDFSIRVWIVILAFIMAGCASTTTQMPADGLTPTPDLPPTLDLSLVGSILPTIPPDEVAAFARLAGEPVLTAGKTMYDTYCAECHGSGGEGQFPESPLTPDETGRFGAPPHNDTGHTWHHDDDLLTDYVRNGGIGDPEHFYDMPAFEDVLSDNEIDAVIAYIKSLWTEEQRLIQARRTLTARASQ